MGDDALPGGADEIRKVMPFQGKSYTFYVPESKYNAAMTLG
jgi:hypothetical protein